MKKIKQSIIGATLAVLCAFSANAATQGTSDDWERIAGKKFAEYQLILSLDYNVPDGIGIYMLDSFPCVGQVNRTRVFLENQRDYPLFISCLFPPKTITLGYRMSKNVQKKNEGLAEGIMVCTPQINDKDRVDDRYYIYLSKCATTPIGY